MEKKQEQAGKALVLVKAVLSAYIVTAVFLLLLSFLMFKAGLDESKTSVGIIAVYVLSTFLGGRIVGKQVPSRKFFWGMLAGLCYFLVLLLLTFALAKSMGASAMQLGTTLVLCLGGGMLGGMLS